MTTAAPPFDAFETRSEADRQAAQFAALRACVTRALEAAPHYQRTLEGVSVDALTGPEALAALLSCVEAEIDRFVRLGPRAVASAVEARLAYRGEPVSVDGAEGTLLGLNEDGALRLRTSEGERAVRSGTLRRATPRPAGES